MSEDPKQILNRASQDSETLLGSSLQRAADHFSGRDKNGVLPDDKAERYGRLAGRWLAIILAMGAVLYLLSRT